MRIFVKLIKFNDMRYIKKKKLCILFMKILQLKIYMNNKIFFFCFLFVLNVKNINLGFCYFVCDIIFIWIILNFFKFIIYYYGGF